MTALLAGLLAGPAAAQAPAELAMAIERRQPEPGSPATGYAAALARFYPLREWRTLWTGADGLNDAGRSLRRALTHVADHGLEPADYGIHRLDSLARLPDAAARAALEVEVSLAALRAAQHLGWGITVPGEVDRDNDYDARPFEPDSVLAALAAAQNPGQRLLGYAPASGPYRLLTRSLAALRRTRDGGGWQVRLPDGPTLRPGDTGPRVATLRAALVEHGDLDRALAPGDSFDAALAAAVLQFQYRHGLVQDTAFGPRGRAELAVPLERRIEQVRLGLERMRWLPWDFPGRYLGVNLAAFRAYVFEGDSIVWAANTVIGKQYHETPMFVGTMTYLVINPYWIVPASIARAEILPHVQADPGYLAKHHMEMNGNQVRQTPGPWNSLGRFKFMFPNRHNVYLHDTPARSLFGQADRAFSHGCVRVEHPEELAALLLAAQGWTPERIQATVDAGEQVMVTLDEPLPVLISYATAFSDPAGLLHFRRDVYGRDDQLRAALRRRGHGSWEG